MHVGLVRQVRRREVVLRPDPADAGPVLAEQGAVARGLVGVPGRPAAEAVCCREEQCRAARRPGARQDPPEGLLRRRLAHEVVDAAIAERPAEPALREKALGQREHERVRRQLRRAVAAVPGAEEGRRRVASRRGALVLDEPAHVPLVAARVVEAQPADGVLDPEQVLEAEGDPRRRADEQDVVRDLVRIDAARRGAVAVEPLRPALAGQVIEHLHLLVADLAAPMLDQGVDLRPHRVVLVLAEDDRPTGLGDDLGVDVERQSRTSAR